MLISFVSTLESYSLREWKFNLVKEGCQFEVTHPLVDTYVISSFSDILKIGKGKFDREHTIEHGHILSMPYP